jgi:hypothetical protein
MSKTKQDHHTAIQTTEALSTLQRIGAVCKRVMTSRWFAPFFILLLTLLYFLPIVIRINSYMPGGDSMFNAWVLARNQNCIMRKHCPNYTTANIYYPHKDTMLYSETELSPSVVTLPIRTFTDNPIIAFNVITILSYFMAGWSMYLLARYLTKGSQFFSLASALVFESSYMMLAASTHLPNLSIFCVPLAILGILKYMDVGQRRYLAGIFLSLAYVFFASWYEMIFTLFIVGLLLAGILVMRGRDIKRWIIICAVVAAACLSVLPLAREYLRFSHENGAVYTMQEKIANSSSLLDYFAIPPHTAAGKLYRQVDKTPLGPETGAYAGMSLYIITAAGVVLLLVRKSRITEKNTALYIVFTTVAVGAFIASLGPFLKIEGKYLYTLADKAISIPLPWYFVDKYIPALGFMRGMAKAAVIVPFALSCLLALFAAQIAKVDWYKRHRALVNIGIGIILFVDFIPLEMIPLSANPHSFSHDIPAIYKRIKNDPAIDSVIVLQAKDYPNVDFWFARTEVILWAGYHNKNVFNGYSGYIPPTFEADFVNLDPDDPAQMRAQGIKYVVVDTELYTNKPEVLKKVPSILGKPIYTDGRYKMYKL